MNSKDLNYYLDLNYALVVKKVVDDEETYFEIKIRELDPLTFHSIGETIEEALDNLENVKAEMFQYYLDNNLPIPEPESEPELLPSGKFLVRTSPKTHKGLISLADNNNQSLNAYVNSVFERVVVAGDLTASFTKSFQKAVQECMSAVQTKWEYQVANQYSPKLSPRTEKSYDEAA